MLAELVAALEGQAVVLAAALPIVETVTAIETAQARVVLVLVEPDLPAVERAMLLAAIGPLAVAQAPGRLCALDVGVAAVAADVLAGALFLAGAKSTTGQVLAIG